MARNRRKNPVPLWQRELWTKQDMADVFGICRTKLQRLHSERAIPKPIRLGASLHWRVREVVDWMSAGCPERVHWTWTPSALVPLVQQIKLRKLELAALKRDIEKLKQERAQICAPGEPGHGTTNEHTRGSGAACAAP